jgi:hypothetical protein
VCHTQITRTFPNQAFFGEEERLSVFRVVNAYCVFDKDLGYSQGMCFLAGVLRLHFDEETTFWSLAVLFSIERYNMRAIYDPSCPALQECLTALQLCLNRVHPQLASHFTEQGVELSMIATQWFLTLFVYRFPFPFALECWQGFFRRGIASIVQVGVSLLLSLADTLLGQNFETIVPFFNHMDLEYISEEVVATAARITLDAAELKLLQPFGFTRVHMAVVSPFNHSSPSSSPSATLSSSSTHTPPTATSIPDPDGGWAVAVAAAATAMGDGRADGGGVAAEATAAATFTPSAAPATPSSDGTATAATVAFTAR